MQKTNRIKLNGHVLMFGDVLLTRPYRSNSLMTSYKGGDECTVAKLSQPIGNDRGRVLVWGGRRYTSPDGTELRQISSICPSMLSEYYVLADAPPSASEPAPHPET